MRVARLAARADEHGNMGIVVGATVPDEVAEIRTALPQMPFLLPGVGAQGGDLERSLQAAWNGDPAASLVNASRSVIYAPDPGRAAAELRDQARAVVVSLR
jgi:orotidine-5'-phosphate decarboxylase